MTAMTIIVMVVVRMTMADNDDDDNYNDDVDNDGSTFARWVLVDAILLALLDIPYFVFKHVVIRVFDIVLEPALDMHPLW